MMTHSSRRAFGLTEVLLALVIMAAVCVPLLTLMSRNRTEAFDAERSMLLLQKAEEAREGVSTAAAGVDAVTARDGEFTLTVRWCGVDPLAGLAPEMQPDEAVQP